MTDEGQLKRRKIKTLGHVPLHRSLFPAQRMAKSMAPGAAVMIFFFEGGGGGGGGRKITDI